MTEKPQKTSAPRAKRPGISKRLSSIESRISRLVARARKDGGTAADRLDLIESWILDLMMYLDIEVSELIEATGEEESR